MEYTKEEYLNIYDELSFARQYYLVFQEFGLKGILPGFHHLRLGDEALPVAIYKELKENDWMMPHLSYHPMTAKTVGVDRWLAELLAKPQGINGGMAGEAHFFDPENRIGPVSGLLGTSPSVATGIALNMKMNKVDGCIVCLMGDGTINEGPVSEALNISAAWKLPIVWVIDNNGIAESTPVEKAFAIQDLSERAKGFGLPGSSYDGTDVFLIREVLRNAMEKARNNEPQVVEFRTARWLGHFVGDPDVARDPNKVKEQRINKDPIKWNRDFLTGMDIATVEELDEIDAKNDKYMREKLEYVLSTPEKTKEQVLRPVFAENEN